MPDSIGPHLLGRFPSPPDERDFKSSFLLTASPLEITLAKLVASKSVAKATKDWAKVVSALLAPGPTPDPTPTPVPVPIPTPPPKPDPVPTNQDVTYTDAEQLDQADTGHCVGFGWCQWGNTLPIDDKYTNADGHTVYYEAKVIDGEPKQENGSTVRSGASAMQNRKRNTAYAFAGSITDIKNWLHQAGPVVVGTDWFNNMFKPDSKGYVKPTGGVAGGHCYALVGDLVSEGAFLFQNSWGKSWGLNGYFKMKYADFQTLLDNQGEACVSLEIPLP